MKQIYNLQAGCLSLMILLSFFSLTTTAQTTSQLSKIYLQAGSGSGSYKSYSGELGLQAIFRNKWSAALTYQDITMVPKNLPKNYQPETGFFLVFPYTNAIEVDMAIVGLTVGRYFSLGKKAWVTTEAGLSYVKGEQASFQPIPVTSSYSLLYEYVSSNYKATIESKSAVGAILRTDFNWAVASFFGFGAGINLNLNSIQSPVEFEFKFLVGKMRKGKKRNKPE